MVVGNEHWRGWQRLSTLEKLRQSLHNDRARGFPQPCACGFERFTLVVHLRAVVEHDEARGCVAGQHQFDRVVEIVDARSEYARFGLGDDGP